MLYEVITELVLERDDPDSLMAEFDRFGEVAVIDLDAALRNAKPDGTTANTAILKSLLRRGNVRVGGGIRDAKRAKELLSLGAEKVIIGSAAFAMPDGAPGINTSFLASMAEARITSYNVCYTKLLRRDCGRR